MYSRWGLNWKSIWRGQHATHSKTSNNTILQITKRSFTGYQLVPYTHLNICFEHRHLSNTSTMMACSVLNLSSSNCPLFSPSWLIGMHLIWLGRGEKHSDIQRESKHIYDYTRYRVLTKHGHISIAGWTLHPIMVHLRYKINTLIYIYIYKYPFDSYNLSWISCDNYWCIVSVEFAALLSFHQLPEWSFPRFSPRIHPL